MIDLITRGGALMIPILLGSVVALGVFLERLTALRRAKVAPRVLAKEVARFVAEGALGDAAEVCRQDQTALARILAAALAGAGAGRAEVKERVEEVGRREAAHLERYVGVLGVIASIEPLLGLLGTVTGMIGVFQKVVSEGVGDPTILAGGIWEALITTAAGLTVAIPVYLAWRFLLARVRDLVLELEEQAAGLVDVVAAANEPGGSRE